jgi:hypothetical protein
LGDYKYKSEESRYGYYAGTAASFCTGVGLLKGALKFGRGAYSFLRGTTIAEGAALTLSEGAALTLREANISQGRAIIKEAVKGKNILTVNKVENLESVRRVLPYNRVDFIAGGNGIVIPKSASRLEKGFRDAGFRSFRTESPGTGYFFKENFTMRLMKANKQDSLRGSFGYGIEGGPINPFTLKPPQPSRVMPKAERKNWIRKQTHIELYD